jgi:DNA-binding transcriptional LysR family regulator
MGCSGGLGAARHGETLVQAPTGAVRSRRKEVNLAGVDLNLLVALEALLSERSVTLAANRVGLSQPAMSRALGRLRGLFSDDLLVRSSAGLVLTRRADQLAEQLPPALASIRALLNASQLDPHAARTTVTIAMPDHQSLVLLPRLMPRLRRRAPHLDIVTQPSLAAVARRLEAGEADLAIGCFREAPTGFYRRTLYSDRFACLVCNAHPVLQQAWTVDRFASLRHAMISPAADEGFAEVYDLLGQLEMTGRDPLVVPNAMTAPFVVAETDIALILPLRAARHAATLLPLAVLEPPIEVPAYEVALLWHQRRHRDPDFTVLRAEIAAATLAVVSSPSGSVPRAHIASQSGEPVMAGAAATEVPSWAEPSIVSVATSGCEAGAILRAAMPN